MKKFLMILLVMCLMLQILPAGAEQVFTCDPEIDPATNKLEAISLPEESGIKEGRAIWAAYTADNKIFSATQAVVVEVSDGFFATPNLPLPVDAPVKVKAYVVADNTIVTVLDTTTVPEKPQPTSTPKPTPSVAPTPIPTTPTIPIPTPSITPTPTATPSYPSVYDSEMIAVYAFMVVQEVNMAVVDEEEVCQIKAYYQGKTVNLTMPADEVLNSVPESSPELSGAYVSALKEGDVIYATSHFAGTVAYIDLIYRPAEEDIVTATEDFGADFEKLLAPASELVAERWEVASYGTQNFRKNQYAFGLIKDKTSRNLLVLSNKAGNKEMDLYLPDNAICYVYDRTMRRPLFEGTAADVLKSEIPRTSLDEDGNITSWEPGYAHNYALVRMYDGEVVDVIVYLNYNV